jgi:hypothetical protein
MKYTPVVLQLLLTACAAALVSAPARAQGAPDPTRPAAALLAEPGEAHPAKAARSVAAAASASASAVTTVPRLQSVQVNAGGGAGAASALLDGRLVRVGDRVGDKSVATIDRHGLTLRGPNGEQRLSLLTGITQAASRAAPPATDTLATGTSQDNKP